MSEKKKTIIKTIEYIENHLNEELKLDTISTYVGYSKFHLNRLFSETAGYTMHKYIQKRRLTAAAEKLVTTKDTIAEIAYAVKYESQQAFTLAFRQLYVYTPQAYRTRGIFVSKQDKLVLHAKLQTGYTSPAFCTKMSIRNEVKTA